ncbi:metalloregulator ArsR/SmtB family transcription factor [Agromyces sp. CFH 90414]|uniref:Metalloregulator ArsR/SmtB family transcription factor n=1 Tax=Agromyces agglutinans TaxID=2662258 RepID=A0A6I2F3D7_9MICO|nr:metalloregulator ArsR/SmtB family transcription factor [Agromyces agglutinans]MRG58904.1 metalloregulator ArsR/SmtB family transcription factor [Agromyces agglutinans]
MAADPLRLPAGREEPAALDREAAESLARTLRAIADPTRLQLLSLIRRSVNAESTVGELADHLRLTQPTVSHHLRIMVDDGLLVREQRGRHAWFSVASDRASEIDDLLR